MKSKALKWLGIAGIIGLLACGDDHPTPVASVPEGQGEAAGKLVVTSTKAAGLPNPWTIHLSIGQDSVLANSLGESQMTAELLNGKGQRLTSDNTTKVTFTVVRGRAEITGPATVQVSGGVASSTVGRASMAGLVVVRASAQGFQTGTDTIIAVTVAPPVKRAIRLSIRQDSVLANGLGESQMTAELLEGGRLLTSDNSTTVTFEVVRGVAEIATPSVRASGGVANNTVGRTNVAGTVVVRATAQGFEAATDTIIAVAVATAPASTGKTLTENLPGGATMEFVWIEPGTFTMGAPKTDPLTEIDDTPQHEVTISRGYYLGKYELFRRQWEVVMGTRPWEGYIGVQENPDYPAVNISWFDMHTFIHRLNQAAGDSLYRLPTEAEWEYACRAGTTTRWSFGNDENKLGEYAWYYDNACGAEECYGHIVGTKKPNPWGLYDMHGNVGEWCQDWYEPYTDKNQVDPTVSANGSEFSTGRVMRSGSVYLGAQLMRSATRRYGPPEGGFIALGARLVRMAEPISIVPERQLRLTFGQDHILANGLGESRMQVEILDQDSRLISTDNQTQVSFRAEGPATVVGSNPATAQGGVARSTLRSQTRVGWAVVTASAEGFSSSADSIWIGNPPASTSATREMVLVPAGEFTMGSNSGESDEQPVHTVYLDGYYIDQYEVTNAQYQAFVQATDREQLASMSDSRFNDPQQPVVGVTWFDAEAYCQWAGLRLPTEAEWEKAARGTDGRSYPWGEGIDRQKANYGVDGCCGGDNSDGYFYTAPVGSFPAGVSPYGAYDMAGNVWEWVADWYGFNYYSSSPVRNPQGPPDGVGRVSRGGSWSNRPNGLNVSLRAWDPSSVRYGYYGFRCARDQ